ncbi:MAG TPA: serine hydrolase domain-containing protein [Methylomirabilota bacterium]|nr:serine hydrolase domain-containing protein [Methylomirabilota bacterium]
MTFALAGLGFGCAHQKPIYAPPADRVGTAPAAPPIEPAATPPQNSAIRPEFNQVKLQELDAAISGTIQSNLTPGVVLWIERQGLSYVKAYGNRAVDPEREEMTVETIFDAASLTKVMATGPAILALIEDGKVGLEDPVSKHLPEFTGEGRDAITIRHLLTHTSALPAGIGGPLDWEGHAAGIKKAIAQKPTAAPDTLFRYSDVNFILLGGIIESASGISQDAFCEQRLFAPLGMQHTRYLPPTEWKPSTAPTERVSGAPLRGVVHDPTARRMGGVAGHAGLFTTSQDLARFARMLLNAGALGGVRVFQPASIDLMTRVHTPEGLPQRALSWDINSPYAGVRGRIFPLGSYGHTGWTGCSVWIDPASQSFVILMSNRNHPEGGNVVPLRSKVSTLAAEAMGVQAGEQPSTPPSK